MNTQRIVGLALLALGAILLVIGLNSSHSTVDKVSEAFTGRYTDNTMWYIIGGIVAGAAGIGAIMMGGGKRSA